MAENVGSVFWEVEMDSSGMLRGMRQVDRRLDDLNSNLNNTTQGIRRAFNPAVVRRLAGGVAKAVGAATLAFVAFAAAVGSSGRELEVMARLTGVSIERMQALSFATETMLVSGEQFSDMAKDIRERMGEFDSLDEGGFNDFIDVMGKTKDEGRLLAKQLETLSGPQVLQYLVTEMENAGKSAGQISFALEGLASDSTKLIPLFTKNGKLLEDLEKKFNKTAGAIDADTFKEYKNLSSNMRLATKSFKTFLAEALSPLIPAFNEASVSIAAFFKNLTESTKEGKKAADINSRIAEIIGKQINARGRVVKVASKEAEQINKLLILNDELDTKINKRITAVGRSAEAEKKKQRENSVAWKAQIEANDIIIDQLRKESEAAQKVFNIRKGIATVAPSTSGGTSAPQTSFETIGNFGDQGGDIVSKNAGAQEGEFGSFGTGSPFNVQVVNDDSEEILDILSSFRSQRDAILMEGESPADRERREYAERIAVISEAESLLGEKNAEVIAAKEEAHKAHEQRMTQISKDEQNNRLQTAQSQLQGWESFFSSMASLSEQGGKKSFNQWKKMATAQAAISTALAVINALAQVPYPANIAAAAGAGLAGAASIAKIQGTTYSGRAQGGVVKAGNVYPVNEAGVEGFQFRSGGKEYLRPMTDGKVIKNSDMKGGKGGESKNFNINFQVSALDGSDFNSQLVNSRETIHNIMMRMDRQSGRVR